MAELEKCRYCDRPVKWAETLAGRKIPLDPLRKPFEPEPTVRPNVVLEADGRARILRRAELDDVALGPRYVVHWATCPYSRRVKEFMDKRRARAEKRRARLEAEEAELDQLRTGQGRG